MTTKAEFFKKMNKHRNTKYRCVNGKYIVEYECGSMTTKNRIQVWRHQRDGGADESKGETGYSHGWVKVTSDLGNPEEMDKLWSKFTTETAILKHRDGELEIEAN